MSEDSTSIGDLESEVHVWLARPDDLNDRGTLEHCMGLLSPDEQKRGQRFHFERDRKLHCISHALLRTSLSRYAEVAPSRWRFSYGEFERPEISDSHGTLRLRFNLSHTEGLAAVVVCRDLDCGVDVERTNRVRNLEGVAKRVLTSRELEDLGRYSGDARQGRFTDYWTLKEAYMKACGMGFQLPPHSFSVQLPDDRKLPARLEFSSEREDRAADWQLSLQSLSHWGKPTYRLATALRARDEKQRRLVVRQVAPGSLG